MNVFLRLLLLCALGLTSQVPRVSGSQDIEARLAPAKKGEKSPRHAILVDGFDRSNPADVYYAHEGYGSSLRLNSSRIAREGDYAMELEYALSSNRSWGTWVRVEWRSTGTALNWLGTEEVLLWVKGDGSGHHMRFLIMDGDRERWQYEDREILKFTRWMEMRMPVRDFVYERIGAGGDARLDLDQVTGYGMVIAREGSSAASGVKTAVGRVQVDQLILLGNLEKGVRAEDNPRAVQGGSNAK